MSEDSSYKRTIKKEYEVRTTVPTKRSKSRTATNTIILEKKQNVAATETKLNVARVEEPNFSHYNKKKILKHLKKNGCSVKNFEEALKSFKLPKDVALSFLNRHIQAAEDNVYQECESLSFENISEWLKLFKDLNLPEHCAYEPALVVDAIANHEQQPKPDELGGIDLKSIYKFLSNAMLGLPQTELKRESTEFLTDEFELLINEANTKSADVQTSQLKSLLQNVTIRRSAKPNHRYSLDPFLLCNEINK